MPKKKKKRSRQSLVSKVINVALLALGFSHAINMALAGRWGAIVSDYSLGLAGNPQTGTAGGKFEIGRAGRAYGPAIAAAGLGLLKSYLMKKFPVRR